MWFVIDGFELCKTIYYLKYRRASMRIIFCGCFSNYSCWFGTVNLSWCWW
ncbi:succinate--CoA ligase [ADP-forming] subunit alpha, mitochondrial [Iris pallida]|uniref:Succinate--CoA ligase [ADP-forming] subunit alpha, mitochondrial n=1 Tax=Iris pallida TaxID=29817 RepID=A0AAX6H736_IRIPA|nr:succinate--CoA ligase [ADP-forming] subunit alpha, mitochondrial [Iris pallida]KAJ6843182.1 succinate--CoA ligase [ADP-forming] subunit alpha, mitochondrial [Iris pallida]